MSLSEGPRLPDDFDEKLATFNNLRKSDLNGYNGSTAGLYSLMRGDDSDDLRQYYPDWTTEDVKALLEALGEPTEQSPLSPELVAFIERGSRPANYKATLEHFKKMKVDNYSNFYGASSGLYSLMQGDDADGIAHYYPNWTREDVRALLTELGELDDE
ncbi:MAG: hypothetical protein KBC95_02770 [Candidatus Peribacteraceae bacterium]|nr:hypothetical protein [Candidatus Peribacteraceae bacterium]